LTALLDPLAQVALLRRTGILAVLCALALYRRPAIIRCCLDRSVRNALRSALGDTFDVLATRRGTAAADPRQASWSPLRWACVGYHDWSAGRPPTWRSLQHAVRLSMPSDLLDAVCTEGSILEGRMGKQPAGNADEQVWLSALIDRMAKADAAPRAPKR
jgi:hypothetical protein